MAVIVSILGVLIVTIGLLAMVQPQRLLDFTANLPGPARFRFAIPVRLVLDVVLVIVAPECRLPQVVRVIGIIGFLAAVIILLVGQSRLDALIACWIKRPQWILRISAVFAIAFGTLLLYAGAQLALVRNPQYSVLCPKPRNFSRISAYNWSQNRSIYP